jgi:4-amino-4-deoxy-L-arabinose transferase-like glycosyltransferase
VWHVQLTGNSWIKAGNLTENRPSLLKGGRAEVRRRLTAIILVALALRLAVIALPNFENLMDADHIHAWEQGNVAEALLAGHGFGSPLMSNQPSAILPPVYPLIVAVLFHFFGVHTSASILAVHVLDCLTNALACIPIFLVAGRSFGESAGWWAAWGWAFFPYGIYFSAAWAWSTHLLLLCICWLVYLAQDLERSTNLGLWAGFGLLSGFAGLTEPSALVLIPFLLGLACWRLARDKKKWMLPGAVASLAIAATLSPWLIRNAMVFHRFIPMRDSMGLELWMGNNGYDLRWTSDDLHPLHDAQELATYDSMGELAYMNYKEQQAEAYIRDHPAWYAWMCVRRSFYIWTGFWSFNSDYLKLEPMDPANIPFATCFTLLGILGLVVAWNDQPLEAVRYAGVLFLFPIMYYFTHPEPYHLRSVDPLLVVLGCNALLAVRRRLRAGAMLVAAPEPAETVAAD